MTKTEPELVTKAEFARRVGVSRPAVSRACNNVLKPAVIGKHIDPRHQAAIDYAALRDASEPGKPARGGGGVRAHGKENEQRKLRVAGYYAKTLQEIVDEFGSQPQFESWVRSAKLMEEHRDKQIRNDEREGALISRDLVRQGVIVPIDAAHKALLNDGVKSVAARAHALALGGSSVEEVEKFTQEILSKILKRASKRIEEAIGNAE